MRPDMSVVAVLLQGRRRTSASANTHLRLLPGAFNSQVKFPRVSARVTVAAPTNNAKTIPRASNLRAVS